MDTEYEVNQNTINAFVTYIGLTALYTATVATKLAAMRNDQNMFIVAKHFIDVADKVKKYLKEHEA